MTAEDSERKIDCTRADEYPCSQKMQTACPTILVEQWIVALGADGRTGYLREHYPAVQLVGPIVVADRERQQRRRQVVADVAQIKTGMHHQNQESAERQSHEARSSDPMADPHPAAVSP